MNALSIASELVAYPSVSRSSNVEVTRAVARHLEQLGFALEWLEYDDEQGVRKACVLGKKGEGTGGLAWFGHTDVVPADPWFDPAHGPFEPRVVAGRLYGRGSCDMKGPIACLLAAAARLPADRWTSPLYFVCTADEEIGYGGARTVVAKSRLYRELVAHQTPGIIGEPTKLQVIHSHKGSCGFQAVSHGRAAHSSTREGLNANLAMIPFLAEMKAIHDEVAHDPAWQHPDFDPPTICWNIGINDHTPAVNITPPQSICTVYFRSMPGQDPHRLVNRARAAAERCGIEFQEKTVASALYTDPNSPFVQTVLGLAQQQRSGTVSFGTDGVMFGELRQLLVLGPGNIAQAHTHDEFIELEQLEAGTELYRRLIAHYCQSPAR